MDLQPGPTIEAFQFQIALFQLSQYQYNLH